MVAYRGVSATDTISTFNNTTSTTTIPTNTLTTTYANEYVVSVYSANTTAGTWTAPASTTSRVDSASNGTVRALLVVDESQAAAGTSTARTATLSATNNFSSVAFSIIPSGRYWVGGSGTWDTTTTTGWSFSSGGSSGAPVPTAQDNVTFDSATTYTVTCTGALTCNDITVSAGTVTFAVGTTPTFAISGSMSLAAATVWNIFGSGVLTTFNATSTGKTITTNGAQVTRFDFNGVGGGWTLGGALTLKTASNTVLSVTAGTFNTGNYNITSTGTNGSDAIVISGSTARTVNLGSSTISIAGGGSSTLPWDATTTTNLTFSAGSSTITFTSANAFMAGGGLTYNNVSWTSTGLSIAPGLSGNNTFVNLSLSGRTSSAGLGNFTLSGNQTITNTLTLSAGTDATYRTLLKSDAIGTTRTLTVNSFAAGSADWDFQDITIAGAAAPISGTRFGDCKGNSGITFGAGVTKYWNLAAGGNWSATGWATTGGGTPAINNFPLAQDTCIFQSTGLNSGATVTISASYNIGTIDMSARTSNTMTLAYNAGATLYGNWINGTGTTLSGTSNATFSGRNIQTITSAGKTFTPVIFVSSPSGTVQLADPFTCSNNGSTFYLTYGTLDLNGKTLTLSGATSQFTTSVTSTTRNLTFNGGTLVLAGSGTAYNGVATGFTTTAGTGTGTISLTSASAKTFAGAGATYNCTLNQGGAGTLTISGSNTFNDITATYTATGATTITFTNATTTTVAAFTATGTAGKLLTLNNVTAGGTTAVVALTGGGSVTTPDYLNVKDLSFTPFTTNGTAPYKWYAGANSTNSGNNSGILFAAATTVAYLLLSGTSWTVPANWNNASNAIHMIGGGGGGGGSRYTSATNKAAGGGGGGGGYRVLTNQTLSGSVAYSVGAAGTAGASAGGTGGTGGTTTFNAQTATGGGGGSTTTTPTSVGGTGGTGTYSGGNGGAGATTTTSSTGTGSGGGGGSAGPNGNGGAGGAGFSGSLNAGGGGGGNGGGSAGAAGVSNVGGTGGNNFSGTGGGTGGTNAAGTAGTNGGGGGGGANGNLGAVGGTSIEISNTVGGGGGAGGSASNFAGVTSTAYGAGGSGGGNSATTGVTAGGAGGSGLIFIIYTPSGGAYAGNFFMLF
jgi:hypothetical protein